MSESLKTTIIAVVLLITLFAGWFFFLYRPKVSRLNSIKEESTNLMLKLKSLHVNDRDIRALEDRVELLRDAIKISQQKIVTKDQLENIVGQIRSRGQKYGLKFHSMLPDYDSLIKIKGEEKGFSEVSQLKIEIKMQGYYKRFGQFIDSFDEFPFLVSLGEITVNYNGEIHPELEIYFEAILYLRENDEPQKVDA